jgi:hypothetical protein
MRYLTPPKVGIDALTTKATISIDIFDGQVYLAVPLLNF